MYELALVAVAAVVIFAGSEDVGTSLLIAAGIFVGGQFVLGVLAWIGSLALRVISWVLFGPDVSYGQLPERRFSFDDHSRMAPEEKLRWANREREFVDPEVTPTDVIRRKPVPRRNVSPRDIDKLPPEERLRWANREGEFADEDPAGS
ncbi:MAG: hypothetical protein ACREEE_05745 [Dongiaceae bacterium]